MDLQSKYFRQTSLSYESNPKSSQYMPPRTQWNQKQAGPPLAANRNLSPIQASPIEQSHSPMHTRRPSVPDTYYEDVDPRFAEPSPPQHLQSNNGNFMPHSLQAGTRGPPPMNTHLSPTYQAGGSSQDLRNLRDSSMESLQEGQRSPAASDASHFTSVSQRGVNPNWRPPPGQQQRPRGPPRVDDIVLAANPEFSLPGVGASGRGGRGGFRGRGGSGMGPSGGVPGGLPGMGMGGGLGPASGGGGRYPSPN
jgi:hypothetical protein